MPFDLPFYIWRHILEEIYFHLAPETELDRFLTDIYLGLQFKDAENDQPPDRVKLLIKRYLDYPDFYSDFVTRKMTFLPLDNVLLVSMIQETSALREAVALGVFSVVISSAPVLPVFEFNDPDLLAEVRENFESQLVWETSLFPVDPSPNFVAYYWSLAIVVRSLLAAYFADQAARVSAL